MNLRFMTDEVLQNFADHTPHPSRLTPCHLLLKEKACDASDIISFFPIIPNFA